MASMTEVGAPRGPQLRRFLFAGAAVGSWSALLNSVYLLGFGALLGAPIADPGALSVAFSSLLPSVLSGFGFFALVKLSPQRATWIFVTVTLLITLGSFAGVLQATLPNGEPKPPWFDWLVMPMHLIAGGMAAWLLPKWATRLAAARGELPS